MIIKGNTIIFKSIPEFYEKEKSGIKNNTVRFMSWCDIALMGKPSLIKIVNSRTGDSFCRELQDVSQYKDVTIFTWKHGEAVQ